MNLYSDIAINSKGDEMQCYRIFTKSTFQQWPQLLLFLGMVLAFFCIIILNVLLIVALIKTNRNISITTKLFIYLSCCDLITGLVTIPTHIVAMVLGENSSCFLIGLQAFFNTFPVIQTMSTIFTLSVFRFIAINKPLKKIDDKTLYVVLAGHFIVSVLLSLWYLRNSLVEEIGKEMGYLLILATNYFLILIGSSVIINIFLHFKLKKNRTVSMKIGCSKSTKRHKNAIVTMVILTLTMIVCYLPNGIFFTVVGYNILRDMKYSYRSYAPLPHFIMLTNAGWNSLVYIFRTRKIRQYLRDLLVGSRPDHHFQDQNSVIEPGRDSTFFLKCKLQKFSEVDEIPPIN